MRVSEPVEQDTFSQAESGSDQEDVASEEGSLGREGEANSDSSYSSDSEVSVEDLKRVIHCHSSVICTEDPLQGAEVPFEQLLQQRQEGSLASKPNTKHVQFRQQLASSSKAGSSKAGSSKADTDFKRQNKNRPVEQSSKRPVPRHRQVVEVSNRYCHSLQLSTWLQQTLKLWLFCSKSRDPRFENLSGKFSTEQFRKQYAFVYDEALPEERKDLKHQLQGMKDPDSRQQLQTQLARVEQQIKQEQTRRQQQGQLKSHKAEERAAVKQGKQPFFMKRSEAKRQELIAKYKHLKATGGLEKVVQKRRRRNALKDHRYVPSSRSSKA